MTFEASIGVCRDLSRSEPKVLIRNANVCRDLSRSSWATASVTFFCVEPQRGQVSPSLSRRFQRNSGPGALPAVSAVCIHDACGSGTSMTGSHAISQRRNAVLPITMLCTQCWPCLPQTMRELVAARANDDQVRLASWLTSKIPWDAEPAA